MSRAVMTTGLRSVLPMFPSYLEGVQKEQIEIPVRDGTNISALV